MKWLIILLIMPFVLGVTCEQGDGCKPDCINGDKDCTCGILNGYECLETQFCSGSLLNNGENMLCCSEPCKDTEGIEDKGKVKVLTKEVEESEEVSKKVVKKNISIGLVVLLVIAFVLLYVRKMLRKFS